MPHGSPRDPCPTPRKDDPFLMLRECGGKTFSSMGIVPAQKSVSWAVCHKG